MTFVTALYFNFDQLKE